MTYRFLPYYISGIAKFVDKPTHLHCKNQTLSRSYLSDVNKKNVC